MNSLPSNSPFPVLVLCAPTFISSEISNNAWMKDLTIKERKINVEKMMGQWYNLYNLLSANALVYLLPPKPGLQDQTYVNSFVCLHNGAIVLSNFSAEGRAGEEIVAKEFLINLGYPVTQCPYKFEGYPELKYSGKENIYYGGYGIRTELKALNWLEKYYNIKIIKLYEADKYLYHLDCSLFVLNKDNVMLCTEMYTKKEKKQIEKIADIHPVSADSAFQGACNSIKLSDFVINSSSLDYMKSSDTGYKEEVIKNDTLEEICDKVGLELIYVDMSEGQKSGALCSCFATPLNYTDLIF
jgi:N-dimethylarginine dimethylaminohydrolase